MTGLTTPNYTSLESKIVASRGQDKAAITEASIAAHDHKKKLDFIMTRFIEDFGAKLDVETKRNQVYFRFTQAMSNEYAKATRMLRLITFYNGGTIA